MRTDPRKRIFAGSCLDLQLLPVARPDYRVGLPGPGSYRELLNTDAEVYGGGGVGNPGELPAEQKPWHDQPFSAELTLPPLGVLWLVPVA